MHEEGKEKGLNDVETNLCVSVVYPKTFKSKLKRIENHFLSENEMKCAVSLLFPLSTVSFVMSIKTYDISIHVKNIQ